MYYKEEASSIIKYWARVKWEQKWVGDKSSQYQNNFELQKTLTILKAPRRVECIWYRLRLMQSKLNACLFKIGKHSDGLCTECNIKEDCRHFLLNCKKTEILRNEIQRKIPSIVKWSYESLLTNPSSIKLIINHIIKNNIAI